MDPHDPERPLLPEWFLPVSGLEVYRRMSRREEDLQAHAQLTWMLSQFLHGEQGALYAAAQVTEAVPWLDGKLYGSTHVITDEARHVHFGVLALEELYTRELPERERREREEWAFEVAILLRNRFLAHELHDEFYAPFLSRAAWDRMVLASEMMRAFRETMFRRIVPNLKRIGLLSDRIRPRYEAAGLLAFEHGPAAPELTARDLLEE